ncbi:MAG: Diphosphomevalonate decarboxylase [Candidatus Woesebacteria bacterium GW2011_GWA1_37_8]|uniref:diphosphomevalonate decarboxylase n=2 Tax=Candidatus Woeseibacteriota TaxID=1752722 RepID=A0A0G0L9M0_9BACT|nr:MAG: Diphosphomevalonate decarboxylase [Microgenomates group bacterium GW2011_GWC1_37_12b]KKQ45855.1 MAG: Diphosphomevalonate decarboxylase [Candidatus Woesebacteria bacterium GW2011_GWA1_37_8]KKQ87687.1 MAG: Diphosphomevalonate decarboxylase [Candidatus Woesebacteria bacterium GW2011_GWB1_38_8b]
MGKRILRRSKTSKATAVSPANIAFIKYWGKKNSKLNIPFNDSVSMNLDKCLTTTTVEFNPRFRSDKVIVDGKELAEDKKLRVLNIIDLIREKSGVSYGVKVVSKNNFPSDSGIASSASAFSALALAGSVASDLTLSEKELSILARIGSGSASRSIVDGFAWWKKGANNATSFAAQIAPESYWDLRDIVVVVEKMKKKSSTEGHGVALTSPFFKTRQKNLQRRTLGVIGAIKKKNFLKLGELIEQEAIELHVMAMTSNPPIFYWNKGTVEIMNKIRKWREVGLTGFFTMDAGANVHVICLAKDVSKLNSRFKRLPEVLFTISNKPCRGTQLTNKHLF